MPALGPGLHISWQTETMELAGRILNPRHQPAWFTALEPANQAVVREWSEANPLNSSGADRVREHDHWKSAKGVIVVPRVRSGCDAAIALVDAAMETEACVPLLILYALQDDAQLPAIVRRATAEGLDLQATRYVLERLIWPMSRMPKKKPHLLPNVDAQAAELGISRQASRDRYRAARDVLHGWLHAASVAFLKSYSHEGRHAIPRVFHRIRGSLSKPKYGQGWWVERERTFFGKQEWRRILNEAYRMNESYTTPARPFPAKGVISDRDALPARNVKLPRRRAA
jgi:hypothetical protein